MNGFLDGIQRVMDEITDHFGDFVICACRRNGNSQKADRCRADFQPCFFRPAAVFYFLNAVSQAVRIFDGADGNTQGAGAGNQAQGVLAY